LEDKVQRLEAAVAAADASVATGAPSLEVENRFLKGLLESVGFERGVLEGYLQGPLQQYLSCRDSEGPAVRASGMARWGWCRLLTLKQIYGTGYVDQVGGVATMEPDYSALNPELFGALDLDSTRTPQSVGLPLNMVHNQVIQPKTGLTMTEDLAGVISRLDGEIPDPNNSVNSETTLCSVAFHLIIQCNRTGKDVLQIEIRLRTGYKMPTCPGEGCRVDNMILLGVLAELV
jgi:hypothetical protein